MEILLQQIINGLVQGSVYALVALGYTMVYGILGFINFAHGEVLMIGAYIAYSLVMFAGLPWYVAMLLAMLLAGLIGVVIERFAYRPLRDANRLSPLITAIALSIFLQSLVLLIFGADIRTFRTQEISKGYTILGAVITGHQLLIIATTIVLMLILYLFVTKTKLGTAMRAATDNRNLAAMIGVNTDRVIAIVFAIGSALAAAA